MQKFGPYTVHATIRHDNPAWPQFTVMRAGRIIGRSVSALDLGWCEFIERMAREGRYAEKPIQGYSYRLRGVAVKGRSGRPTNAARAQAAADLLKVPREE